MKKIQLSKETLRVLTASETREVGGGSLRDDCNPTDTRPATGCGGTTTGTTVSANCPQQTSPQATCPQQTVPNCPTPTTPEAGCPGGTTGTTNTIRRCPV